MFHSTLGKIDWKIRNYGKGFEKSCCLTIITRKKILFLSKVRIYAGNGDDRKNCKSNLYQDIDPLFLNEAADLGYLNESL